MLYFIKISTDFISFFFFSEISGVDAPWGGCRVPEWWKLYYKNSANQWVEVESASQYGTEKGVGNEVIFTPVTTQEMKLEVKLPAGNASGLFEWEVE